MSRDQQTFFHFQLITGLVILNQKYEMKNQMLYYQLGKMISGVKKHQAKLKKSITELAMLLIEDGNSVM